MYRLKSESLEALDQGRVRHFVTVDFINKLSRVHCGKDDIDWNGHSWKGVGDVLKTNMAARSTAIGGPSPCQEGSFSFSLPYPEFRDTVNDALYLDRGAELEICALAKDGVVIERVGHFIGKIVSEQDMMVKDNIVTFTARDDVLTDRQVKSERLKTSNAVHREVANKKLRASSIGVLPGLIIDLLASTFVGSAINLVILFLKGDFDAVKQGRKP